MKDSILVGPGTSVHGGNKPSGPTKQPKGHNGPFETVAFSNTNLKSSAKADPIGLNSKISDTKLKKD